jgi:predicted flap endonuclease-1-like 5' DNA nuclease
MPTVAELERLDALVSRLVPLANVRRGAPVRAQDWNDLVGVVIEVARVVLAEERQGIVAPHEHADQVKMAWLDPQLRAVVERGPLADPAAVARVTNMERRLERLTNRIDDVDSGAKEAHDRAMAVSTRDLVRESQVTAMRRTVEGLADARDSVLELRGSLRSIEVDVRQAVDVGQRLVVDGQPVDMAAWDQRLRGLEELRTRLTMPNGELLDAGALERRLVELTNTLVTEEELDEAFASRPIVVPPDELASLQEEIRAALTGQLEASLARLAGEIRAETGEKLANVDARIARGVSDAVPGIVESVQGSLRPEISRAVEGAVSKMQDMLNVRLGELREGLSAEFEQKLAGLQAKIGPLVAEEVNHQLASGLERINRQLGVLAEDLKAVQVQVKEHDEILRNLPVQPGAVDFTRINGIDEAAAKRLVTAGVQTFAQLAAMSADRVGAIIGMAAEKVIALEILPQARRLAQTG